MTDIVVPQGGEVEQAPTTGGGKPPIILKKLSNKHKEMISLALQGKPREYIGQACKCRPEYVTFIMRQPLARAYIAEIEEHLDSRLRGMYNKSLDAIEDGLGAGRVSDRLAAAKLQLTAIGKVKPDKENDRESAEDVVGAMLQVAAGNVTINVGRR